MMPAERQAVDDAVDEIIKHGYGEVLVKIHNYEIREIEATERMLLTAKP